MSTFAETKTPPSSSKKKSKSKRNELSTRKKESNKYLAPFQSSDPNIKLTATTALRSSVSGKIGAQNDAIILQVIQSGVVPYMISYLSNDNAMELQLEAAWVIANLSSNNNSDATNILIKAGVVSPLIKLLSSTRYSTTTTNEELIGQVIWALANIAGDSSASRDIVLRANVILPLRRQMQSTENISLLRRGTWLLDNLTRAEPRTLLTELNIREPILTTLTLLISNKDEEILKNVCLTIGYLALGVNENITDVIDSGIVMHLIPLLKHPNIDIQKPAARALGNVVTGNSTDTQICINCGALPCLKQLLSSSSDQLLKDACWAISNIAAGTIKQIEAVVNSDVIPTIIKMALTSNYNIAKECAWILSNVTCGSTQQIQYLIECECSAGSCILAMCNLLFIQNDCVSVVLDGLLRILQHSDVPRKVGLHLVTSRKQIVQDIKNVNGLKKIKKLIKQKDVDISTKAKHIVDTYFTDVIDACTAKSP